MVKSIYEVLKEADAIRSVEDRIKYLQENNSNALQTILKVAYDSTVSWLVPDGEPPYKPLDAVEAQGILHSTSTLRRMKMFVANNGYDNLPQTKRENLYIQFLESIDKEDARIVVGARNGRIPFRKITKSFVRKAFPDLIQDNDTSKDDEESK